MGIFIACVCVCSGVCAYLIGNHTSVEHRKNRERERERASSDELLQITDSRQQQGNSACNIRDLLKGTVTAIDEEDCPALVLFLS